MSDIHHELILQAKVAIDKVFGDTSVGKEDTAASLKELVEEIEVMLDKLE